MDDAEFQKRIGDSIGNVFAEMQYQYDTFVAPWKQAALQADPHRQIYGPAFLESFPRVMAQIVMSRENIIAGRVLDGYNAPLEGTFALREPLSELKPLKLQSLEWIKTAYQTVREMRRKIRDVDIVMSGRDYWLEGPLSEDVSQVLEWFETAREALKIELKRRNS